MTLDRLTLIALVSFSAISTDLYLAGIPSVVQEFGVTSKEGQLTLGIFMLGFAFGQLIYGPIADVYGRKPVLYVGLSLYLIASIGCAWAMSIEQLILARLCQALAAASGPVLARAMVVDLYEPREAAKVMATLAACMAIIPAIAPILGSWMLYWFDWRVHFYTLALFGLIALAGVVRLQESWTPAEGVRLSFAGIGRQFVASLRNARFVSYTLVGAAQFAALFSWITTSSFVITGQFGLSEEHFGYTFAWVVAGYVGGAFIGSRIVLKTGPIVVIGYGVILGVMAAAVILIQALLAIENLLLLLLPMFGIFMACGLVLANCQSGAASTFPKAAGQASSVFGFCQTGVAALTSFLLGQLYQGSLLPLALVMMTMCCSAALIFFTLLYKYAD